MWTQGTYSIIDKKKKEEAILCRKDLHQQPMRKQTN